MGRLFNFEETEKYGIRKGIVFYFGDSIDSNTLLAVESIIEQFLLMTRMEFTKKRGGNDYVNIRNLRSDWRKVFHREFDCEDFSKYDTRILTLDSCTPQRLQAIYAIISMSNDIPMRCHIQGRLMKVNRIYFQLPLEIEWSAIFQFIVYVNEKLNLHYASAGYEMAWNIHHYPGSAGYAIRTLKNLKYVNSDETEWEALFLVTDFGIPCPNFIQVLCSDLAQRINNGTVSSIYRKWNNNRLFLDILNHTSEHLHEPTFEEIEARYKELYQVLLPIIVSPPKSMFMKENDWKDRLKRFETRPL